MDGTDWFLYFHDMVAATRITLAHFVDSRNGWLHDFAFPDWDLWTVLDGSCILRQPGGDRRLEAGDCLLLRPGERHRIDLIGPRAPLRVGAIHFLGEVAAGQPFRCRFTDLPFALSLMQRIVRQPDQSGLDFLAALLAERLRMPTTPADAWWRSLEALSARISERPHEDYSILGLARRLHCSPAHLSRRFRTHAGIPLSDHVIISRIRLACNLLSQSDLPMKAIARRCGYRSVHFFSRQFHQRMATAPTSWRARLRDG